MLMRPSNICNEAPSGAAGFAVVEPPPFFQGVVRQSLARTIFNAGLSSAQARQIEVVWPRAIDGDVVAGIGMSHHPSGGDRSATWASDAGLARATGHQQTPSRRPGQNAKTRRARRAAV